MVALLILSLTLELSTGIVVWNSPADFPSLHVLLVHALACMTFAVGAIKFLSQDLAETRPWEGLLFFALSLFVPVVGMFGLCWVLSAFHQLSEKASGSQFAFRTADNRLLPQTPPNSPSGSSPINTGMLISALQHAQDPSKRTSALFATLRLPDHDAVNILRVALRDSEDDVRLLAYSLLTQMDKRYNDKIQSGLAMLEGAPATNRCFLHKQIAQDYWELTWVGLARGESVMAILRKAQEHAVAALKESPVDGGLQLLLGKILLRLRRYEEASDALSCAEVCGLEASSIAPYHAEISLWQRRVSSVIGYMGRSRPDLRGGLSAAVRSYWGGHVHEA